MASPARQAAPGYGYSTSAFPPLNTSSGNLSQDAFPALSSQALGNGLPPSASQQDLSRQQRALLLAREQHRANLLGSVNNGPSPNVSALLSTLNGRQFPPDEGGKAAAAATAAAAAASLPPGIAASHAQLNGTPPRQSTPVTVVVAAAQATLKAAQGALETSGNNGSATLGQTPITPMAVQLARNALDSAISTQGPSDKVVVSGPGAGVLVSLLSPDLRHPAPSETQGPPSQATPAQQVYLSPVDRFGLVGLLSVIKSSGDASMLSTGVDLSRMGLNMNSRNSLASSFVTPWAFDAFTGQAGSSGLAQAQMQVQSMIEPEFHLPPCYNVQPPPPAQGKIPHLMDETLFFVFYSAPRDALQELAARELYQRGWRYHKVLRLWLTKPPNAEPIQKTGSMERGTYVFFDPGPWEKVTKVFTLQYDALENRPLPSLAESAMAHSPLATHTSSDHAINQSHPGLQGLMGQYPQAALAQQMGLHSQAVQAHALAQQRRVASQSSQGQAQNS